uniref:Uncharacterized protein n=1 Tax=Romanomermis culicivorax TaxID=13658 RepID=A0A915J5N5_ROMCU
MNFLKNLSELTSVLVTRCRPSLTMAKFPLPIVFPTSYNPRRTTFCFLFESKLTVRQPLLYRDDDEAIDDPENIKMFRYALKM